MSKSLDEGEELQIDSNSVVAWSDTADLTIKMNTCCNCCCGGEGMFNTVVRGPGKVWLQTMGLEKFKGALADYRIQTLNSQGYVAWRSGAPATHEDMVR